MFDLSDNGGLQILSRPSWRGASLLYAIRKLGLSANLQLCLDAGDAASYPGSGQTLATGQWAFSAIAVNESAPSIVHQLNAQVSSSATGYSSPATGDATTTLNVGALGAGGSPLTNGSRQGFFAAWSRALSQGELAALFNAMRGRFGV